MTNSNPNSDIFDSNSLIWWTGIIAPEETWNKNIEPERWSDKNELPGWGTRYRVRIFGQHTASKEVLPDEKLPLCEVVFPVTAGTGHAASWQSSNLRQGSVVVGFYKDGIRKKEPIIMGCIGTNDQQVLLKEQQRNNGFQPYSGFTNDVSIPSYAISSVQPPDGSSPSESSTGSSPNQESAGDDSVTEEDNKILAVSEACKPVKLADVSVSIKNLILAIEKDQAQLTKWKNAVRKNDFSEISQKVTEAQTIITAGLKGIIGTIQPWIEQKISAGLKDLFANLNPAQQGPVQDVVDVAMQEIHCLFRRIIDKLFKNVGQFLVNNIQKYINVPLCAVENIVGTLVGNAVALIEDGIKKALEAVEAIAGAISLGEDILGFIIEVLNFSFCDGKTACPDLEEWDIWRGAGFDPLEIPDPSRIISKAKETATKIKNVADVSGFKNLKEEFNLTGIVEDNLDKCNVGAISCGPPQVRIFGGGGIEAAANAVIGAAGEILAVDITNFGFNYKSEPFIQIVDPCGRGTGAVAKIRTRKNKLEDGGVVGPSGVIGPGGVVTIPSVTQTVLTSKDDIFDKDFNLNAFDENVLRNSVVKVTFSCTRDEDSGSFFQFKIPGESINNRTRAGKRKFSISTADIKKNRIREIKFKMAAGTVYSVEGFVGVGKEKINLEGAELGTGDRERGARGSIFSRSKLRIPLANKRIRVENKIKRITKAFNKSIKAGTTIVLDDIVRKKRKSQNGFKLQYTNLSASNAPIIYDQDIISNFLEDTNDTKVTLEDGTKTSILEQATKFSEDRGKQQLIGKRLFFRDDSGNNLNGVLILTDLDDKESAEFAEDGRKVFAIDPTRTTRFRITLIYKDGANQDTRIFDNLVINKKEFNILNNTKNEDDDGVGVIEKTITIPGIEIDETDDGKDPDGIYNDLVITADKGYFYFDRNAKKYFFRVDPEPEDLKKADIDEVKERISEVKQYSITADKTKVKRKELVKFNISTVGIADGTILKWQLRPKGGVIDISDFNKIAGISVVEENEPDSTSLTSLFSVSGPAPEVQGPLQTLPFSVSGPAPEFQGPFQTTPEPQGPLLQTSELYGSVIINNSSATLKLKISNSASIGDAFTITLSKSSEINEDTGKARPKPKKLAESQIVTVVDDIIPTDPESPNLPPDIDITGIGTISLPLVPTGIGTLPTFIPTPTPTPEPTTPITPETPVLELEFDDGAGVSIVDVVIVQAGSGYTGSFTGELGGLGRVWAGPFDTLIQTFDFKWEPPVPPGFDRCYKAGDKVTLPAGTSVVTTPRNGRGGGETIVGGSEYTLQKDGCFTTPQPPGPTPTPEPTPGPTPTPEPTPGPTPTPEPTPGPTPGPTPTPPLTPPPVQGEYEVDLCLEEIVVIDPGFGYTEDDIIIINPSNGAEAEFTLGSFGTVESVRLLNREKVCGFRERPEITIQSPTGRNVKLVPKFSIDRVPLDTVNEPGIFERYITVIDCVGRAPEQDFFRIPD